MITWYLIMAAWVVVTIIDCCIIDCCSDRWAKANVIIKDLCIISNIIAIICLTANT